LLKSLFARARAALAESEVFRIWSQDLKKHGDREGWFNRRGHIAVGRHQFGWQLVFPSARFNVGVDVSADAEELLGLKLCVPPVSLFLGFETWPVGRKLNALLKALGVERVYSWEREVSLCFFDWAVWWKLWVPSNDWHSSTPRWRYGAWHPFGFPGSRVGAEIKLVEKLVDVPLEEGPCPAFATLIFENRRDQRWPWLIRGGRSVWFDFEPSKGVRRVDDGHRKGPTYGMGVSADSLEEACERMAARITEDRRKNGWRAPALQEVG
jgi:hypothetical protein